MSGSFDIDSSVPGGADIHGVHGAPGGSSAPGLAAATPFEEDHTGLRATLAQLRQFAAVVLRRKYIVLAALVGGLALGGWWVETRVPLYEASATVMINTQTPRVLADVKEVLEVGTPNNFWAMQRYYQTQSSIIKSHEVAQRVLDRIEPSKFEHLLGLDLPGVDLTPSEKWSRVGEAHLPSVLSERLSVDQVKDTLLLWIQFQDTDPEFAADIVNKVAEAFQNRNVDRFRDAATGARDQLKRMMVRAEQELQQAEGATAEFESEHELASIPTSKKNIEEKLRILTVKLTDVTDERIAAGAKVDTLMQHQSAKDIFGIDAKEILDSPVISQLKQQAMTLATEVEGLKERYDAKWPDLQVKQRQLNHLLGTARREIRGMARSVEKRHVELLKHEKELRTEMEEASREESRLSGILRRYDALSAQRKQRTELLELLT